MVVIKTMYFTQAAALILLIFIKKIHDAICIVGDRGLCVCLTLTGTATQGQGQLLAGIKTYGHSLLQKLGTEKKQERITPGWHVLDLFEIYCYREADVMPYVA